MTFIGVISESKVFENIKESLKDKEELKVNLIHINKKSVENIKNIKFETIIIDSGLENLDKQTTIIEKLCQNAKYLVVNTDVNLIFNLSKYKKSSIITYGLNQKATVTISSITDTSILIFLQKNIKNINGKIFEIGEKLLKIKEDSKLKTYEILIIYIILLINSNSIIQ